MKINVDWDLNFENDTRSSGFRYWVWVFHVWSTEIKYKTNKQTQVWFKIFVFVFVF